MRKSDAGTSARLLAVLEVIASRAPDGRRIISRSLLDQARAFHLTMDWLPAVAVCETVAILARDMPDIHIEARWQGAASARAAGEWRLATSKYDALHRLARRYDNTEFLLRSDIGRANILMERGNLPGAEELINLVIARALSATTPGRPPLSALWRAMHTRGVMIMRRGRFTEAIAQIHEAFLLCDDPVEQECMLHDIAACFTEVGYVSAARNVFLSLRDRATNCSLRWSSRVNLMEIAGLEGDLDSFEAMRLELMTQKMRPLHYAHYLYLAGEGYERLGDPDRALEMYILATAAGESLGIWEVVVRAEARSREVHSHCYLRRRDENEGQTSPSVKLVAASVNDLLADAHPSLSGKKTRERALEISTAISVQRS